MHQRGGTLSGGEQQMLAIGRALMAGRACSCSTSRPSACAPILVQQIFKAIVEINRTEGLTILLVEQNAYQALKIAHRGYVLATGRITHDRAPGASCWPTPRSAPPISRAGTEHACTGRFLGTSLAVFIGLTLILIGGAAIHDRARGGGQLEAGLAGGGGVLRAGAGRPLPDLRPVPGPAC